MRLTFIVTTQILRKLKSNLFVFLLQNKVEMKFSQRINRGYEEN